MQRPHPSYFLSVESVESVVKFFVRRICCGKSSHFRSFTVCILGASGNETLVCDIVWRCLPFGAGGPYSSALGFGRGGGTTGGDGPCRGSLAHGKRLAHLLAEVW